MSEATKNRRPSGGGESAPVLTVVLPAGARKASELGKKTAGALGKTLKKAAKAADEAGLAVTLDLGALSRSRQSTKTKPSAKNKAGGEKTDPKPGAAEPSGTPDASWAADSATKAAAPAPVKRAAATKLPGTPPTTQLARKTAAAKTTSRTRTTKSSTPKTAPPTASAEPSAGGGAPDSAAAPSGARRVRPTPRRTPARPPVTR